MYETSRSAFPGDKMDISGGSKAVQNKLEGGGEKHTNSWRYHLAGKQGFVGTIGPQAPNTEAPNGAAAGNSVLKPCGKCTE